MYGTGELFQSPGLSISYGWQLYESAPAAAAAKQQPFHKLCPKLNNSPGKLLHAPLLDFTSSLCSSLLVCVADLIRMGLETELGMRVFYRGK